MLPDSEGKKLPGKQLADVIKTARGETAEKTTAAAGEFKSCNILNSKENMKNLFM
jgi:hypothetical protein